MRRIKHVLLAGLAALTLTACAAMQSNFSHLGNACAPRPETQEVEVFQTGAPVRPFEKISRLDVHMEKTHFLSSSLAEALPELKRQARLSGADAVIDIQERRSMLGETRIYHVTATGIRYTDSH